MFLVASMEAQFGAPALHLFPQVKHAFDPEDANPVGRPHFLDLPYGLNRLSREKAITPQGG